MFESQQNGPANALKEIKRICKEFGLRLCRKVQWLKVEEENERGNTAHRDASDGNLAHPK